MTKASDNPYPSILITEGTEPSAPAAGKQRIYIDSTTHHLKRTDSSGTDVDLETNQSSGAVATDGIWDAAGDLAVGTGADTAAKLSVGSAGTLLEVVSGTPAWRGYVGASYSTNAGASISTGTGLVIVDFEDSVFDPQSAVTTGASWHYTCPYDGFYRVSACVFFAASTGWAAAERGFLQVYKNTSAYRTLDRKDNYVSGGSSISMLLTGSTMVSCSAGDTLDIRLSQNSGGSIALAADGGSNWVDISRIR